ncbi:hypothetical protein BY458DRAFT_523009 [Sporodiniella umbellata]|nr:hypothetical protein BY458DRAFT_523009 [Sporodiniella umbellata]
MKTEIKFIFEEQYFDIRGRSQAACDETMEKIVTRMLPVLCSEIDDKLMNATYEDPKNTPNAPSPNRQWVASPSQSELSSPSLSRASSVNSPAVGRAPKLDVEVERKPKKDAYYYNETESDGSVSEEEEFEEIFTFAKNIRNPAEVLYAPSVGGKKPVDYLSVIGNDTDTECSLIDKTVRIVGSNEASVKEALSRFKNLQTIYKRSKRPTSVISCVSIEGNSDFGIFFCDLDRFAHKHTVELLTMKDAPYYVLLPVFKDERGGYQRPRDLVDASAPVAPPSQTYSPLQQQARMQRQSQLRPTREQIHYMQQQQQHRQFGKQERIVTPQEELDSLEERMRKATFTTTHTSSQYGMAPDQRPLWGENKNYVVNYSAQKPSPVVQAKVLIPTQTPQKGPEDDFPALQTTLAMAPLSKGKTKRVMRISSQKSSDSTLRNLNYYENLSNYNFHIMRTSLSEGLESIRGYRGKIKLSASVGQVLWTRLQQDIRKTIWSYQQLNDLLIKERGVRPIFNGLITRDINVFTKILEMSPTNHGVYPYFEIHARARNQPILPYKPVILHVSQQSVDYKKIVVATQKITEINYNNLGSKLDFQINLEIEELTREDVKPFSTFLKKISISLETRQLTFENIPDFLTVDKIYLKNTTRIRLHFPFVVEVTCVEELPLIPQTSLGYGNINKILADTGSGRVWYTVEILYSTHDEDFKRNGDLPAGKLASWTVNDILGTPDAENAPLRQILRCLSNFTAKVNSNI